MLIRKRTQLFARQTAAATTSAQTISQKIVMQPRRLVGVKVQITLNVTTAPTDGNSGVAGLVKEIRLRVNDGISGMRNAVQCKGPSLLSFVRQCGVFLDRNTEQCLAYDAAGTALHTPIANGYVCTFFVPCVDPRLGERAIPIMAVPLHRLKEDAVLEVDLGTAVTDIGTACVTSAPTVDIQAIYRDGGLDLPYVPSELVTISKTWAASQKDSYDFAQTGFLTGFLLSNFTSAKVRASALSAAGSYSLVLGTDTILQANDALQIAENDGDSPRFPVLPIAALLWPAYHNLPNEVFIDFLKDYTTGEVFSVGTAIDLRVQTMLGEKLTLFYDQAVASAITWITTHRLMPFKQDDLAALGAGV